MISLGSSSEEITSRIRKEGKSMTGFNLREEIGRIKKSRIKVIPPKGRIDPNEDIIFHPSPRSWPYSSLELFGRPKKLAHWGFKLENDTPQKVRKIL